MPCCLSKSYVWSPDFTCVLGDRKDRERKTERKRERDRERQRETESDRERQGKVERDKVDRNIRIVSLSYRVIPH